MKKAVVYGANGFIGSALVKELVSNNIEVVAIVHNNNINNLKHINNIAIKSVFENIEELQYDTIFNGSDVFYNFAWDGSSGEKRSNIDLQLKNIKNTIAAMKFAKKIGCCKFINADSIMEKEALFNVRSVGANYIYGSAKLAAHNMCKSIAGEIGISPIFAVITNIYGPGERNCRMLNSTIRKCVQGICPDLTNGLQNYDFIFVSDAAIAFRLIGEKGIEYEEYVIGSSNARPLKDFMLEMKDRIAKDLDFNFGKLDYSGPYLPLTEFDCGSLTRDTGFVPVVSFSDGCKKTYDWILKEYIKDDE